MSRFVTYSVVGLMSLFGGLALAQSPEPIQVDIGAQPVGDALNQFAEQSGLQVVLYADDAKGIDVAGVSGQFDDATMALDSLLASTGLEYSFINDRTVAVASVRKVAEEGGDSDSGNGRTAGAAASPVLMAQARTSAQRNRTARMTEADDDEDKEKRQLEEIIVTGTRIVGVQDQFSPVSRFDREDFDRAGFANVGDLVSSLPQNFGGGVSIDTTPAGSSSGAGAQTINLRGLGAESTLTLLNGRRLAPGGLQGSFVDVSAIPLSAIDRVEVLTDGASAIYGADAIAGVVNIILREDYDGAETRLRYGTATEGDGDRVQIGQTFGKDWDRGRALISYEFAEDDSILSNDKDFAAGNPPGDELLPSIRRHNVFASAGFDVTDRLEVFLDAYYNDRKTDSTSSFVFSLNPGPSTSIQEVDVDQFGGTVGTEYALTGDWRAEFSASLADSGSFGATESTSPSGESSFIDESDTRIWSYEGTVAGPLFSIADEQVRALLGTQYRTEDYAGFNLDLITGSSSLDIENERDVYSAFGEIYLPLINDGNARPGLHRLAINAAVRFEDYSDVGSSTNPKVGLAYAPFEGLTFRGTYGSSFRAPLLAQLIDQVSFAFLSEYLDPSLPGGVAVGLFASGSSSDLDPETADTWTAGVDYTPGFAPGLQIRGTYFNIDYEDRLGSSFPSFDPGTGAAFGLEIPIVVDPALSDLQAIVDAAPVLLDLTPMGSTLADVTVFGDLRPVNTSATRVDGVDLDASYNTESEFGRWSFSLAVSYLLNFDQQFSELTPVMELLDTVTNPADLRMRGGLAWNLGRYEADLYVNYVDDYVNDQVLGTPVPVASWTTVDLGLRTDLSGIVDSVLDRTELTFTVRNLFDRDPPPVDRASGTLRFGYDSANADPRGRALALQITKRW